MLRQLCVVLIVVLSVPAANTMLVKLKALKCFVNRPDLVSVKQCFVKAISRNHSSLNMVVDWKKGINAPFYVR